MLVHHMTRKWHPGSFKEVVQSICGMRDPGLGFIHAWMMNGLLYYKTVISNEAFYLLRLFNLWGLNWEMESCPLYSHCISQGHIHFIYQYTKFLSRYHQLLELSSIFAVLSSLITTHLYVAFLLLPPKGENAQIMLIYMYLPNVLLTSILH